MEKGLCKGILTFWGFDGTVQTCRRFSTERSPPDGHKSDLQPANALKSLLNTSPNNARVS